MSASNIASMTSAEFNGPTPAPLYSLTGIRGVAALWVMLYHLSWGIASWPTTHWLHKSSLIGNGDRGVDLFFILSGFIMMHVHAKDFQKVTLGSIGSFALIRFFRVYPTNFAVLLLIAIFVLTFPAYLAWVRETYDIVGNTKYYTFGSFFRAATLSSRWIATDTGSWNVVTWSLSVELLAYATLPFLAYFLNRTGSAKQSLLFAVGCLTAMILLLIVFGDWHCNSTNRLGLLRGFGGFAAGAAMCRYVSLVKSNNWAPRCIAASSVAAIGLLSMNPSLSIFMPFAFAALVASLSFGTGYVDAFLRTRMLIFLGKISFSLYLIHLTMLFALQWIVEASAIRNSDVAIWIASLVYVAAVLVVAAGLHRFVERPFQQIGKRISKGTGTSNLTFSGLVTTKMDNSGRVGP